MVPNFVIMVYYRSDSEQNENKLLCETMKKLGKFDLRLYLYFDIYDGHI